MTSWREYQVPELPETFWAYLAGLIDGEGSLNVYRNGPRLGIANTHKGVLIWVTDQLQAGRIYTKKMYNPNAKQGYEWQCTAYVIRRILPQVAPYLHIKKDLSLLILKYLELNEPLTVNSPPREITLLKRKELKAQIRGITSRGHEKGK